MVLTKKEEKEKRVVIYARYSSDMQRTESITAQVRACTIFCSQKNYKIVQVYADEAKSGMSDQREQFQKMIADSASKSFSAVVVYKLDRFSRDQSDTLYYEKQLANNNVALISVTEAFDDSPEGVMMKAIIMGMNQYYVLNLGRLVRKGHIENVHEAKTVGGRPPLGYDVDPQSKQFVINDKEANAVRLIYKLYVQGKGYNYIIKSLNGMGYLTKAGKPFGKNSLYEILNNPKYKGTYVYSCQKGGNRSPHRVRAQEDTLMIEDALPAIVSKELWQKANDRLEENKRNGGSFKAKIFYLLSGKVQCGLCGYRMHGNNRSCGKGYGMYASYRCNHRDNNLKCSCREIKKEDLERYVLDGLQAYFLNKPMIITITRLLNQRILNKPKETDVEKRNCKERIKQLEKMRDNLVNAIANTGAKDSMLAKLEEVEKDIAELRSNLETMCDSEETRIVTREMVQQYLGSLKEYIQEHAEIGDPCVKSVINKFVDRVVVYEDRVEVIYKIALPFRQKRQALEYQTRQQISRKELKERYAGNVYVNAVEA